MKKEINNTNLNNKTYKYLFLYDENDNLYNYIEFKNNKNNTISNDILSYVLFTEKKCNMCL